MRPMTLTADLLERAYKIERSVEGLAALRAADVQTDIERGKRERGDDGTLTVPLTLRGLHVCDVVKDGREWHIEPPAGAVVEYAATAKGEPITEPTLDAIQWEVAVQIVRRLHAVPAVAEQIELRAVERRHDHNEDLTRGWVFSVDPVDHEVDAEHFVEVRQGFADRDCNFWTVIRVPRKRAGELARALQHIADGAAKVDDDAGQEVVS